MIRTESFSDSLGKSSKVILNKSPMYVIAAIFFHLYMAENGKDISSSKKHHKSNKPIDLEIISLG
jgi:hypothetical protein